MLPREGYIPRWAGLDDADAAPPTIPPGTALNRMLREVPAEVRSTFTPAQIYWLSLAAEPRPSQHWIDYRVSLPFAGARFYVTLLMGKERRQLNRLLAEGQLGLRAISVGYLLLIWLMCSIGAAGLIIVLYILKSALGVDLFEGPSILHGLFY